MTDWLNVLLNGFGPENKMLEAVTSKDVEVVCDLIQNGFDVNSKLQRQGGNSALHLASQLGDLNLVKYLLKSGGDPMLKNDLNSTSIILAARNQHVECLQTLIKSAKNLLGIESLWLQCNGAIFLWKESTENIIHCLICATPDLSRLRSNTQQNLFFLCVDKQMYTCLRLWVTLGNSLRPSQIAYLNSEEDKVYVEWMKSYKNGVQSLQHHCCLIIRKRFHGNCNVFYGSQFVPLPKRLQQYLCWE